MPDLIENTTSIKLKSAKTTGLGLAQLGFPVLESTQVKKGALNEFLQTTAEGAVGRRYQNLRATAVKTTEGGVESAKLFVQFEVFGDDNVPEGANGGFSVALTLGEEALLTLPASSLFLPYGRTWYENQAVFDLPLAVFEQADQVRFVAGADRVRFI